MKRHPYLISALLLLSLAGSFVHAQTVTLTVNKTVADGESIPVLTWTSSTSADISCTASGGWSGVKAGAGTETLPKITKSTSYVLTCTWPSMTGSATVFWTPPTLNSDGSPLTNLAGFRVMAGVSPDALTQATNVPDPLAKSKQITGLAAGTWSFAVIAYNTNGGESVLSNSTSRVVGAPSITASSTANVVIRPVPAPPVVTSVVVAGVNVVPVFRLNAAGTDITHTPYGLIPTGRVCGAKVTIWRGSAIHRVNVQATELWPKGLSTANLAAPCMSPPVSG